VGAGAVTVFARAGLFNVAALLDIFPSRLLLGVQGMLGLLKELVLKLETVLIGFD